MKQVLFVQLPPPRFAFTEPPSNIPLAAGFLTAALGNTADKRVAVDILPPEASDVLGDRALLANIVERRPDVLALTLYVWNVGRSLFLAANVKRALPETLVLVGGPEVTMDNAWVLRHPAVDAGVFGEGESRIASMLLALSLRADASAIPGTFVKRGKEPMLNRSTALPWDLDAAAYPYVDGRIQPSRDGTLFLETVRGCPYHCRYCYYHKAFQGIRGHADSNIARVLDLAYSPASPVRELYLMDPTFNGRAGFRTLLKDLAVRREQKDVLLHTELRADLLTREDVALLKDAGLASAEVGLQTTNITALREAGRTGDPAKVARGVALLKDAGIDVTTGIILGLPEDTPERFTRTLQWLEQTAAYSVVHPFVLAVLPGTDFRASALSLGLEYDPRPPYYVKSTPTFPAHAFRPALLECERVFDMELDHISPPSLVDSGPAVIGNPSDAVFVSKWIVKPGTKSWKSLLPQVAAKASDPFTIWFRGRCDEEAILFILRELSSTNPHMCMHVVMECSSLPAPGFLHRALTHIASPHLYQNRSYQPLYAEGEVVNVNFWLLLPDPGNPEAREALAEDYEAVGTPIWDVGLGTEESLSHSSVPVLISARMPADLPFLQRMFDILQDFHANDSQEVLFRDQELRNSWQALTGRITPALEYGESILLAE